MIDLGSPVTGTDGESFVPGGGKPLPPLGWGKFAILDHEEKDGNIIYSAQTQAGEEVRIYLGFAGSEPWMVEQARTTLGKMIAVTGIAGINSEADLALLHGQFIDIEIIHKPSKKMKADGTPFINANPRDFAPAGTKSSVAAPAPASNAAPPQSDGLPW